MHPGAHKDCTTDAIVHGVAWVTFALFLLGAAALLVLWSFMDESRTEPFVGCFFVCSIAAMTYFCKASGYGEIKINGTARLEHIGRLQPLPHAHAHAHGWRPKHARLQPLTPTVAGTLVPIARYIDWITTTPLLMYELGHLAHASTANTMMLVGSDILMIAAGILSACLDRQRQYRMILFYFAVSCVFYVVMLCIINVRLANGTVLQQTDSVQELFGYLKVLTSTVWTFYPIVVFLGRAQCHLISKNTKECLFCFLDLAAKLHGGAHHRVCRLQRRRLRWQRRQRLRGPPTPHPGSASAASGSMSSA